MKAARARRARIVDQIATGTTSAESLAERLGVSLSTVRRDLDILARDGVLLRTYGGAVPVGARMPEQSLAERATDRLPQKRAIARLAAAIVQDGESVILDAGTTTGALAVELRHRAGLRVITSGLTTLTALADAPGIEVLSVGGMLRPISLSFVGPHAEQVLRRVTAARAFLGADGVVAGRGLCEATATQAALKELMTRQADALYVLATADKLGRAAFQEWTPLDRPWTLITDADATEAQLLPFQKLGIVTIIKAD
ncbi:DeoR/GlpR family DNA-binding transcription regulator [Lichenicola sp.]|uniref:DeoR/GlpR family DNA-binding transcription regulator n=1 Tax=Lichenicola sp. TaxID=2804529 RepID=UPI003AFF67CD